MKTKHRQRAQICDRRRCRMALSPTPKGQPLDDLLRHNLEVARHSALLRRGWLRANYGHAEAGDTGLAAAAEPGLSWATRLSIVSS